ncbi:actin-binding LIM protein 1 [Trichonephila clavipes]|nr:actin-binding LIM protein 1 [Trichonephila clavipes]
MKAGDNHHFHPTCARCSKCGDPFGDGEEMYLQGGAIWHPRCGPTHDGPIEDSDLEDSKKDLSIDGIQSGRGSLVVKVTDSWLAYHEFEPSTAEDPPCRAGP